MKKCQKKENIKIRKKNYQKVQKQKSAENVKNIKLQKNL